jgi:hypothetical protein
MVGTLLAARSGGARSLALASGFPFRLGFRLGSLLSLSFGSLSEDCLESIQQLW